MSSGAGGVPLQECDAERIAQHLHLAKDTASGCGTRELFLMLELACRQLEEDVGPALTRVR
ncbi:hypothetical protein [Stappia sp.]|uniref:hypothetical protein n=1 Tax=Stappia sp. TaxID=1870903 RepID=UPI0025DFEE58|nr:hypothetical protein [Stappia sp.]